MIVPDLSASLTEIIFWSGLSYFIGSIPFGLLLAKAMSLGNLRNIGSGNIGATNVLRTGNKKAAALTLTLDAAKGAFSVALALSYSGEASAQFAALSALLGHCYPVWLRFQGGKGVATLLGVYYALFWPLGLAACATWLAAASLFRFSSLAALITTASAPVWALLLGYPTMLVLCLALALLVFWRHRSNILLLSKGKETKIGAKN